MTNENGIKQLGNNFNGVILSYYTTTEVGRSFAFWEKFPPKMAGMEP